MKASAVLQVYRNTTRDPRERRGGKRKEEGRGSKGRQAKLTLAECKKVWAWLAKVERAKAKGKEKKAFWGKGYRAVCQGEGPLTEDRLWAVRYELDRWK